MSDFSKVKLDPAFKHLNPADWQADGISSGFNQIRYKGKQWVLHYMGDRYPFRRLDDNTPQSYIDVIILGVSKGVSRVYFEGQWKEDSVQGPVCASLKGVVPDPGVPIPQAESCAICSHNEWITKPTGRPGKECQEHRRLAVLLMPDMTKKMFPTPLVEPLHLKLPPGSLKAWKVYSDDAFNNNVPLAGVITRISFSEERQFEMKFDLQDSLDGAEAKAVLSLLPDQNSATKQILEGNLTTGSPRVINPPPPAAEKPAPRPVKRETGLLAAFAAKENPEGPITNGGEDPEPKKRGRPKKPAETIEAVATRVVAEPPAPARPVIVKADSDDDDDDSDYEESDTEIDAALVKLMGNMVK